MAHTAQTVLAPPARFPIGTKFLSRGKYSRECTVVDIHRTYNAAGELVKLRYVATHELLGQAVTDYDVTEAGVAIGAAALEASNTTP